MSKFEQILAFLFTMLLIPTVFAGGWLFVTGG